MPGGLTLGRLALFAGTLEAELLAFFLTWVAAKQISTLEGAAQVFIHSGQGFGRPQLDSIDLAGVSAAFGDNAEVIFITISRATKGFCSSLRRFLLFSKYSAADL